MVINFVKLDIKGFNERFRKTRWGSRFIDDLSFFAPDKNFKVLEEYADGWGLGEVFQKCNTGVQTGKDEVFVSIDRQHCQSLADDFNFKLTTSQIKEKYNIIPNSGWTFDTKTRKDATVLSYPYRPFDNRFICYTSGLRRSFKDFFNHFMHDNIGLVFPRISHNPDFDYGFITNTVIDIALGGKNSGSETYVAPLYLYNTLEPNDVSLFVEPLQIKKPNFTPAFSAFIEKLYNVKLSTNTTQSTQVLPRNNNQAQDSQSGHQIKDGNIITPEDILGYIYAILHSPAYRTKYLEFLKIDFPRIPFIEDIAKFNQLSQIGKQLIDAHLLKEKPELSNVAKDKWWTSLAVGNPCVKDGEKPNFMVKKIRYDEQNQQLYFNDVCYFDKVSLEIWNFKIGGYQVLDKYLKERKGRQLSGHKLCAAGQDTGNSLLSTSGVQAKVNSQLLQDEEIDEVEHLGRVVRVLKFTVEQMKLIDKKVDFIQ